VLLKPSPQTPLTAERLALALNRAGLPEDVFHVLQLSPTLATFVIQHPLVDFVSFTGSVIGGRSVEKAAVEATGFKGVALEVNILPFCMHPDKCRPKLGGKDAAYVRQDADIAYTVAELVDGEGRSMFHWHQPPHLFSRCILQLWSELLRNRGGSCRTLRFA
jgi:acyl-CoA reductase-like NAD-dependent aldehyde dehydrogenase